MRLIDADHLKRWIIARWEETDPKSAYPLRAIDIIDQIDREVTIDAEPVKHGRWIWDEEGYHCSECFFHAYGNTLECLDGTYRYCPNCGAKMEDEDEAD